MPKRIYAFLSRWFRRLAFFIGVLFLVVAFLGAVFHKPLFRALGNHLLVAHPPAPADALAVLSGNASMRGAAAAAYLPKVQPTVVVCTGELVPEPIAALGQAYTEGELTRRVLLRAGADSSRILLMRHGTSTREECDSLLRWCRQRGYKRLAIVTSDFHTRRTYETFRKLPGANEVSLQMLPAYSPGYSLATWWRSEAGLLHVVTEYLKLAYYRLAYG